MEKMATATMDQSIADDAAPIGSLLNQWVGEVNFGPGATQQLSGALDRYGVSRALVIGSRSVVENDRLMEPLLNALGSRCAEIFGDLKPHVPRETVLRAAAVARNCKADGVISVGGSTAHDTAKGTIWALADNVTQAHQFDALAVRSGQRGERIAPKMVGVALPIFAIPTTLSAGEFTNIAGITDEAKQNKQAFQDRGLFSKAIFLDPEMTIATPDWLWLSSGIKAVDHCVESILSITAQPYTDALALHALKTLFKYLRVTKETPSDLPARGKCQVAAWLSVMGLSNVSLGLSHGLGQRLGGICKVPHGFTSCVTLPHVLAFNRKVTAAKQAALARQVGLATSGDVEQDATEFQGAILRLIKEDLKLPYRLRDVSVARSDIRRVAEATIHDSLTLTNPMPVESVEQIVNLLEDAW
jgi:maleylacetate reductase